MSAGTLPSRSQLRLTATPLHAGPRDGVLTHVRATLDAQLRALLAHQRQAGDDDEPEAVHQMRVAGRRIRVVLRVAGPVFGAAGEQVRAEVAWLGGLLGPVRDLDVLCGRLAARAGDLPEADLAGFDEVLAALRAARSAHRAEMVTALGGRRYRAALRGLAQLARPADQPTDPSGPGPVELVRRPVRRLRREVELAGREPTEEALHDLRIRGKRVRYAAEFGATLAGRKDAARLRSLATAAKRFQEVLGDHQDTVAAEQRLRALAVDPDAALSPAAVLVLGRLVEREHVERDRHAADWWPAWRAVRDAARPLA
jgi:CHAD domain-containing protein